MVDSGDLYLNRGEIGQWRTWPNAELPLEVIGRGEPQETAVERDRHEASIIPRRPGREASETLSRFGGVSGGDPQRRQRLRAIRVIQVRRMPDQAFCMVSQELSAALGHRPGDAGNREPRLRFAVCSANRTAHVDERQHRESGRGEPIPLSFRIGAAEGGQMDTEMAFKPRPQLPSKRRIARRSKDLDIAAAQHGAAVASPRRHRSAINPINLLGKGHQAEPATFERRRGRLDCWDKIRHMIEKDLAFTRQLFGHVQTSLESVPA